MESRYTWKNQLILGIRNFSIVTAIVLLLAYLVIVSGQAAKQELETMFVEEKKTVTFIEEPVAYGYENGAKIWELRSEYAEQEKETESSNLTRIYQLILFKGGEPNLTIYGNNGVWDKPRETLTLTGDVVVESADLTTKLDTQELVWNERGKVLSCPKFVDFWVEDNHITSESLYSDDDLATIDFVGDVNMFVVGLEGENFVTREGDFPLEDVSDEKKGDGMNVIAEYVHYDKGNRESLCYPFIPYSVRKAHNLNEEGKPLPTEPVHRLNLTDLLSDPEYAEALQESVAGLDLTEEEKAFLRGETDQLGPNGGGLAEALGLSGTTQETTSEPEIAGSGAVQGGEALPPESAGRTDVPGSVEIELPTIPVSDPGAVKTAQDYSYITDWLISPNLDAELFEGDEGFDPLMEVRDGLVFCYRDNKKIWCEELYIDLGEHRIDALRQADGRFRDLKDEENPPENKAGKAISESPTQFIGNYLVHNWRDKMTKGYGRVLVLQAAKDFEADNVIYSESSKVLHAWGNVIAHQYSGDWWVTSGAIEEIDDDRAREDVKNPSVMTADAMLSYNRAVTWGFGNVVFKQEEQIITGDRSQYEDDTDILIMAGTVDYNNEDGEILSCSLLTLDLEMDEYIAEGAAISRSVLPEERRQDIAEMRGDKEVKPEDDARTRLLEERTASGLGDWTFAINNPPPPPIEVLGDEVKEDVTGNLGPEIGLPLTPLPDISGLGENDQGSVVGPEPAVEPSVAEPESAVD